MKYSASGSSNKVIAIGFLTLLFFLTLSSVISILVIMDNRSMKHDQKTIIVPMGFNAPFAISDNTASDSYYQMYSLALLALRLNVSPGTIDNQHQLLLSFFKPGAQPEMKVKLAEEAQQIKQNEVDSQFAMTAYRLYPNANKIDIRGVLSIWIGSGKKNTELKHYVIEYERADGLTWLANFKEIDDAQKN